ELRFLKDQLNKIGAVNEASIEEYQNMKERVDGLSAQEEDMRKAQATLNEIIEQMDREMKKRFGQTFSEIAQHFNGVFQALFGGGRAELVLTNPEDLLTTGVDIVAEPPGKKLQNLNLMSGGEKALTAIALLFSILKVRPVPFSILDEVEAALDEANVLRFARYLTQLRNETQFIVITHRKGTMQLCDVLYGVTMQENGISRLVSVQFDALTEDHGEEVTQR
ncbi:MAG: chromosome segregation protein SMC, partial [Bacilli bacterium]